MAENDGIERPLSPGLLALQRNVSFDVSKALRSQADAVTEPVFAKASEVYGTMRALDPVRDHYLNASASVDALRRFAQEDAGARAGSLAQRLRAFLELHMDRAEFAALMEEIEAPRDRPNQLFTRPIPKLGSRFHVAVKAFTENSAETKLEEVAHTSHSALFNLGTVVTKDVKSMEALRQALTRVRRRHQQLREQRTEELTELDNGIRDGRANLAVLDKRRGDTLDDYLVAQRLMAEHWQAIEATHAERRRIIENHTGLYYVKARETPVSVTLPDPLDLRFTDADDVVPGCDHAEAPLDEDLHEFMQDVLDIPASDWEVLRSYAPLLPGRGVLEHLVESRRLRLQLRSQRGVTIRTPVLAALRSGGRNLLAEVSARPFRATSLFDLQHQAHRILALDDLLTGPVPALRTPARVLQQRLYTAAGCLVDRLRDISPLVRLAWQAAAQADTLPLQSPERWPALARAEAEDFNGLRTLVELVSWWFAQLSKEASAASVTAMRDLVRACIMLAAGDDPEQIVRGRLRIVPGRLRVDDVVRLDLNRVPAPGLLLHLLDAQQQLVGTLRVDDHDSQGTVARVTSVIESLARPSADFHVVQRRG